MNFTSRALDFERIFFTTLLIFTLIVASSSQAQGGNILLVSDNAYAGTRAGTGDPETDMVSFLTGLGHTVTRATGIGGSAQFREGNGGSATAAAVGADLILVSRVTNSGSYDEGNSGANWNAISTPLLLLSPYLSRGSRWQWLPGGNAIDQGAVSDLVILEPGHAFVSGLGSNILSPATTFSRNDLTDPGNGTLIATTPDGDVALVEWAAGTQFQPGGQVAGGHRVLMGGLRYHEDDGAPVEFSAYSANGLAMLGQTIDTMLIPEPSSMFLVVAGALVTLGVRSRRGRRPT